jgi:hypothetical protein
MIPNVFPKRSIANAITNGRAKSDFAINLISLCQTISPPSAGLFASIRRARRLELIPALGRCLAIMVDHFQRLSWRTAYALSTKSWGGSWRWPV